MTEPTNTLPHLQDAYQLADAVPAGIYRLNGLPAQLYGYATHPPTAGTIALIREITPNGQIATRTPLLSPGSNVTRQLLRYPSRQGRVLITTIVSRKDDTSTVCNCYVDANERYITSLWSVQLNAQPLVRGEQSHDCDATPDTFRTRDDAIIAALAAAHRHAFLYPSGGGVTFTISPHPA